MDGDGVEGVEVIAEVVGWSGICIAEMYMKMKEVCRRMQKDAEELRKVK